MPNFHLIFLLGWLYKSFLRNLHEEQRKQLIEPLRPKFVQKLKNESYICKKCGNAFTPAQNEVCYSHQYETAKKCNDFEDNVSLIKMTILWQLITTHDHVWPLFDQPWPKITKKSRFGNCPVARGFSTLPVVTKSPCQMCVVTWATVHEIQKTSFT